jgi:hypothetical protein
VAELLVVIAILAVLASLTASAVIPLINNQRVKNTNILLQKADHHLNTQWSEAVKSANNTPSSSIPQNIIVMAGGDSERARVIWVKLQLRQQFPQNYAEALAPYADAGSGVSLAPTDLPPLRYYVSKLQGKTPTGSPAESAACLLLALERPRAGIKFNADEALGAGAIQDTDGDGLPEIVDGWGNPVVLYRWGTGNAALDGVSRSTRADHLDRDNQDPHKSLMAATWNLAGNPNALRFEALCHKISQPNGARPWSYYTQPTIVSAGKDGQFGLDRSMTPQAGSQDNIYSFQVK